MRVFGEIVRSGIILVMGLIVAGAGLLVLFGS